MRRPRKISFVSHNDQNEKKKKKKKKWCSFYKIIHLSIIQDKRLGIPKDFVKKFEKELPDVAIVVVPSGTMWRIELRKAKGEIWFENGLQEFMDYYSVSVGHFLIFRYDGNIHFHVIIFDMSACEIQYPCHTNDLEESNHERVCRAPATEESDTDVEILNVRHRCMNNARKKAIDECEFQEATRKMSPKPLTGLHFSCQHITTKIIGPTCDSRTSLSPSTRHLGVQKNNGRHKRPKRDFFEAPNLKQESRTVKLSTHRVTQRTETEEASADERVTRTSYSMASALANLKDIAIETASAFKSENPFFVIIMRPTYLYTGYNYANIPTDFAKAYLMQKPPNVILQVSHGMTMWQVGCLYGENFTRLSIGWNRFVLDNHLEEGDICIFELVDKKIFKMKVSVFRNLLRRLIP